MSGQRYTPEFKDEAVRQVVERGYSVADIAQRLGVSVHSLYKWVNAVKPGKSEEQAEELAISKREILKLRAEMRRLEEERDILKKAARYFAREPG
jgi:transposase